MFKIFFLVEYFNMSKKELAFSIVSFLKSEVESETLNADGIEGLEVAIQCIESAYGLEGFKPEHDINLLNVFSAATEQDSSKVLRDKLLADDLKNKGNEFMKTEQYDEAIDSYTKAIELDSKNAVYYCNRAAAWTKLNNNQRAILDCEHAINIDPTYSKAYGRLGLVYMTEKQFDKAVANYKKALSIEPSNQSYKSNLEHSERSLSGAKSTQPPTPNPANPLAGLDLGALLNNPAVMSMAQSFMQNPQMQNMFANLMGGAAAPSSAPIPPAAQTAPVTSTTQQNTFSSQHPTNIPISPDLDMGNIMNAASLFAEQMRQQNPELAANLSAQFQQGHQHRNPNPQNPPDK
ncbi:small glutamine-rich tetratricopeptide repeat-containing protein alpha isoform X2 [Hydra vulgaris]|uniref:Small glutamine-rich tetratricopeptide repeat-containing protein alpha isoform X2 n=1 Tax=Hydra vulgaris TaxID=6087 RepID=A0ABM4CSX3_HYDVU